MTFEHRVRRRGIVLGVVALAVATASLLIWWRFETDIAMAQARAAQGGALVQTRCGPIEVQEAGQGVPLLMIHGADGLRNETKVTTRLQPYDLAAIRAPTLVISARDDGYGTYASAEYTASRIANAKFIGFEQGGHVWVGHDEQIRREIPKLLISQAKP